ncbi:NinE family protein [Chimaeribacter arupi]|uniref:NinE family protein n=1 Tax=Chimaeribacter arupi TaxID=2060066 RepID=UPI000C7AEB08|nr:NinE family protein [Chimaeribacter arupi]PLR52397.1 NinE family protein [Chimaeribacter arupi]
MQRSLTQRALDNLIFIPPKRSRSNPKPKPSTSEIRTYDPVWPLMAKRWLRVRSRK